jgi:hypothetical protein
LKKLKKENEKKKEMQASDARAVARRIDFAGLSLACWLTDLW